MSKVSSPPILSLESMPDAPDEEWLRQLVGYNNEFNDQVARALRNGVTLADNTPYKLQAYNLVHGEQTEIGNPMNGLSIKGVAAMQCQGVVLDSSGKVTSEVYSLGLSHLDWEPSGNAEGSILVTANFDLKHTEPFLRMRKSGNQTIGTGSNTPVTWDTEDSSRGSVLSIASNSQITVTEAGNYLFSATAVFAASASGTFRVMFWAKNGALTSAGDRVGLQRMDFATIAARATSAANIRLEAGEYAELYVQQDTGGDLSLIGNAVTETNLEVSRICSDETPTGKVTLLFYGE